MKFKLIILGAIVFLGACKSEEGETTEAAEAQVDYLSNDDLKFSYAIGHYVAENQLKGLENMGYEDLSKEAFLAGVNDAFADTGLIAQQEQIAFLQSYSQQLQMKAMMKQQEEVANSPDAQATLEKGQKFLEENKQKSGITVTSSGLQYETITKGNGPVPEAGQSVKVHYAGTLIDGTGFDSSYERGEPITVNTSGGVIQGWLEILKIMPVGSKYKIYVPSELAYEPRGKGSIAPNEVLIFEMESLELVK